jgi:uncharacterized lipoprotein
MISKDKDGNYFVTYVLSHPPKTLDETIWSEAVGDYLKRNGFDIQSVTPSTVCANTDWAEIRRIYNRIVGEGKQRRTVDSHPATQVEVKESDHE